MTLQLEDIPQASWWKIPFKIAGWLALVLLTAGSCAFVVFGWTLGAGLPEIPRVDEYRPPVLTEVFTHDRQIAGEFYRERRRVVSYERIPKRLVQAFIAAEDADFFDHAGINPVSTFRAALKSAIKLLTGKGRIQGGSTLTQQTAKAILISAEGYRDATAKNLTRKLREAILAMRLERALSKEEILYLYLNNVYLGHHSYGVASAAENYFRKEVDALTLAEMALIAGLPQAPTNYSPFRNPAAALERRRYVLRQMLAKGMVTNAEFTQALEAPVKVFPVEDVFHRFAPYFTEEVRRDVVNRYGNAALLNEGLQVFTTMDSEKQRAAQSAVLKGLLEVDKRQGFRGPVAHLEKQAERTAFRETSRSALEGEKLTAGHLYVGQVTAIASDKSRAEIDVGGLIATLPALGMRWARAVNPERSYPYALIDDVGPLRVGDVVVVRVVSKPRELVDDQESWSEALARKTPTQGTIVRLEQEPEPQAALVSIEPNRQYLVAMVGGYDFDANEFNRAFQACRQPGSGFKPIVYLAALDKMGWTEATVIVDSPIVYDDPTNQNRWKPENYDTGFKGEVLLRDALINSMNIPAVKTFIALSRFLGEGSESTGIRKIAQFVSSLGVSDHVDTNGDGILDSTINTNYSSALGSSCLYPYELAQVYATIDRQGVKKPTYFMRKVEDRFGRTLEDHTAYDDPWASLGDRIAAGYAQLSERGEAVVEPESAFLITDLLRGVVREGTGAQANRLGKPAAGKTGTTNDSFDGWFNGFTKDLVTTAWVGYDMNPHPLGRYETGGRAALPIWLDYMRNALKGRSQPEFVPSASLSLVQARVDRKTGLLVPSPTGGIVLWFKQGTEPTETQPEKGVVDPSQFMQIP